MIEKLIEKLERTEILHDKLLNKKHFILAKKIQEKIESIREEITDTQYINRHGIDAFCGVSEKDF